MTISSLIRTTPESFALAQKIVTSLSEKYDFVFDEAWNHLSCSSITQLQKRFRRMKRENNPLSQIKKPRTGFSFFTKNQRNKIALKNPKATFGELSKLVSKAWKGLSDKERTTYKVLEDKDKVRYEKEKTKLLASLEKSGETSTTEETPSTTTTEPTTTPSTPTPTKKTKQKKVTKSSSTKTASTGSYNVFQKKQRAGVKSSNPKLGLKDINTKLGEMWRGLSDQEKAVYV